MKKSEIPVEKPLGTQIDLINTLIGTKTKAPIEPTTATYKATPSQRKASADKLTLKKINPRETGTKTISLALDKKMLLKIDEISIKTGKTRTELIRILLDYGLDHLILE